jgi:hypothetical protein
MHVQGSDLQRCLKYVAFLLVSPLSAAYSSSSQPCLVHEATDALRLTLPGASQEGSNIF